jgi:pyruvate dehydrogenase E1 component alpha subunit
MKFGGTNNGMGGIMHVSRPELGVPGREGVFGTRFSIAAGLAMAAQLDGRDDVTLCYYGEAAGARGILYEAMNMAVLWKLPVIFIAENNGWSYSIRTERLYPQGRMSRVWRGFDIPVEEFDGNDVEAVHDTVSRAVDRARAGDGPSVLEGLTYRLDPHHWFDKAKYQPADEIRLWRDKDPIERARLALLGRGVEQAELARLASAAEAEVDAAMDAAKTARLAEWADSEGSSVKW